MFPFLWSWKNEEAISCPVAQIMSTGSGCGAGTGYFFLSLFFLCYKFVVYIEPVRLQPIKVPPPLRSIFPLNCSSWNIFPLKSVSLTRKHFPLRNENNFPLRYENNFPLSNENNFPLRNENNYPLRNANNFPLRNANNFLVRNANNFALWKENIVRIENNFFNANKLLCPLRTLTIRDHLIQRTFQHVA